MACRAFLVEEVVAVAYLVLRVKEAEVEAYPVLLAEVVGAGVVAYPVLLAEVEEAAAEAFLDRPVREEEVGASWSSVQAEEEVVEAGEVQGGRPHLDGVVVAMRNVIGQLRTERVGPQALAQ